MASKATLALEWPVFKPRGWGQPSGSKPLPRPWFGLDTERDAKTGEFVCGWAVGDFTQRFWRLTDLKPGTYWVWNLAYDIEGMLRDLRTDEGWMGRVDGAAFPLLNGEACYYHGKRFDFKIGKQRWNFIEASSFFGRRPLSSIGAKDSEIDASQMSLHGYRSNPVYQAKVDKYCQRDAQIVFDAITTLSLGLTGLGVDIAATPGGTARRFMARLGPFPEILWRTHQAFLRSYCGGRFEVTKRGVIHDANEYDIVSAYPWALSNCPWVTTTAYEKLGRRFSDNALYGSYQVNFSYPDYLGVAPRWRGGVRVYSTAETKTWLARPEVEWLLKQGCPVEIIRGVEVFDENASTLWKDIITELFAMKTLGKSKPDKGWGAKIILNSQYGILIQLVRRGGEWVNLDLVKDPVDFAGLYALEKAPLEFEAGKCYAPLYAGNLTSLTRVRILDAAKAVGPEAYIGGHTDSILTTAKLPLPLGDGLGAWEFKKHADRLDVSKTGMFALGDVIKIRGITRQGTAEMLWEDTHQRRARVGIKAAKTWDDVSVILPKTVANNYTTEQKRVWYGPVTRGLIAMERYVDSGALANVS